MTWFKLSLIFAVVALLLSLVKIKSPVVQWFQSRSVETLLLFSFGTFVISITLFLYRTLP